MQRGEIVEEDGVELGRLLAFAGEAMHPDAIAKEEMVEGTVQREEEGAEIGAVFAVRKTRRCVVEALVDPAVVAREHRELLDHTKPPLRRRTRQTAPARARRLDRDRAFEIEPRRAGQPDAVAVDLA